MNWQFEYPGASLLFLATGILLVLYILLLRRKKKILQRIGDPVLVNELIRDYSARLFSIKMLLLGLAMTAGILAVMNPRKPGTPAVNSRKGFDMVIALDVSRSMLAADLAPDRITRAKQLISKLIGTMPDDRIALVLFAGKAYLQMPLTIDHGAASLYVSSVTTDAVPQQGTVISEALQLSAAVFNPAEKRFRTILLISDGEDHDAGAAETARNLEKRGIMVNTVGIGSTEGSPIPDPLSGGLKKDETGNTVITRLNEQVLKEVAETTGGIYQKLENSEEAVKALRRQLATIEKVATKDISLMQFKPGWPWLAGLMLLLLLAEIFIRETKKNST